MRCTKLKSLEILKKKGLPVGTVIDIGVHKQTPELIQVFPDKLHLLFEPVSEFHDEIKQNYKGLNYIIFPVALYNKRMEGWLQVFDINGRGEITHSSITFERKENFRPIQILTLDEVMMERHDPQPYLIKIDVDGVELQILQGARDTLKKTSCVIIECPISIDTNYFFDRSNFLREEGFVLWDIVDFCYYKEELSQVDLIFLRKDIKDKFFSPWKDGAFDPREWSILK
ncbi:MAG: FkbM family methyltransferase [Candidatus Aenigmatarchaeota archaeon]